jgi:hypothetical protein
MELQGYLFSKSNTSITSYLTQQLSEAAASKFRNAKGVKKLQYLSNNVEPEKHSMRLIKL